MGFDEASKLNDDQINEVTGGTDVISTLDGLTLAISLDGEDKWVLATIVSSALVEAVRRKIADVCKVPSYEVSANDRALIVDAFNTHLSDIRERRIKVFYVKLTGAMPGQGDCIKSVFV